MSMHDTITRLIQNYAGSTDDLSGNAQYLATKIIQALPRDYAEAVLERDGALADRNRAIEATVRRDKTIKKLKETLDEIQHLVNTAIYYTSQVEDKQ